MVERILVDMDGVLCDTLPYWLSFYNKDYEDNLTPEDIKGWTLHKYVKPECGTSIYKYWNYRNFYKDIPPTEGAKNYMKKLHEDGFELIITTAVPPSAVKAMYDKRAWVKKHLPFLSTKYNFIGAHRKDLVSGDILIDDGAHNIESFPGLTCLMEHPYNKVEHGNPDYKVNNWEQFYNLIHSLRG